MKTTPSPTLLALATFVVISITSNLACTGGPSEVPVAPSTLPLGGALSPAGLSARTDLGGLNLNGYCQSLGFNSATLTKPQTGPNAAFNNWRCQASNGTMQPINMTQACRWQYRPTKDLLAHPIDPDDAFSWVCYPAAPTETVTISSTDVPKVIPNPGQVISTVSVPDLGTIVGVTTSFSFTHQCERNLVMRVRHPDGTLNTVMDRGLERCDGTNSLFTSTSLTMQNMLGKEVGGVWQIIITDDDPQYSGQLNSWSLNLQVR